MNATKLIAAALLSGLFLSPALTAQVPGDIIQPVPTHDDPQPVPTHDDPQPVPTDDDPQPAPVDPTTGSSNGGSGGGPRCDVLELDFDVHDQTIRVRGGVPGDRIGILIGLEEIHAPLPGGSVLRVDPLTFLAMGAFDAAGEYSYTFHWDGPEIDPITFFAQAIAVMGEAGNLATSRLLAVEFDGSNRFNLRMIAMVEIPEHVIPSYRAIRRGMLA